MYSGTELNPQRKGSDEMEKNVSTAKLCINSIAELELITPEERLRYLEQIGYYTLEVSQALKKQLLLASLELDRKDNNHAAS